MDTLINLLIHIVISAGVSLLVCIAFEAYQQRRTDERMHETMIKPDRRSERCGELFRPEGSIGPWQLCGLGHGHEGRHRERVA